MLSRLTPEQQDILTRAAAAWGPRSVPANPEAMPPEYWRQMASTLGQQGGSPTPTATPQPVSPTPVAQPEGPPGFFDRFVEGVKQQTVDAPLWDKVLRPTLERAEEAGQIAAGPLVSTFDDLARLREPEIGRYGPGFRKAQWDAFLDNIRDPQGGLDFRGATEAAMAEGDFSQAQRIAAGIVGDPLNLIPGRAITGIPGAARRIRAAGEAAGEAGGALGAARGAAAETGRVAAEGVREYPFAMQREVEDIVSLGTLAGRGARRIVQPEAALAKMDPPAAAAPESEELAELRQILDVPPGRRWGLNTLRKARLALEKPHLADSSDHAALEKIQGTYDAEAYRQGAREDAELDVPEDAFVPEEPPPAAAAPEPERVPGTPEAQAAETVAPDEAAPVATEPEVPAVAAEDVPPRVDDTTAQEPPPATPVAPPQPGMGLRPAGSIESWEAMQGRAPGFHPAGEIPPETRALVEEVLAAHGEGRAISADLRARFLADPNLGEARKRMLSPIAKPAYRPDPPSGEFSSAQLLDPTAIQVRVQNDAGEMVDVGNWGDLSRPQKRQVIRAAYDRESKAEAAARKGAVRELRDLAEEAQEKVQTKASQFEEWLDSTPTRDTPSTADKVLEAIGDQPVHLDDLRRTTGLPPKRLQQVLMGLEVDGRVTQIGFGGYVRTEAAASALAPPKAVTPDVQTPEQLDEALQEQAFDEIHAQADPMPSAQDPPPLEPSPEGGGSGAGAGGGRRGGDGSGTGDILPPDGGGRRRGQPTFGTRPVHGDIQIGGYRFPSLPEVDSVFADMRARASWQQWADALARRLPAVVRVVNAAGTLNTAPAVAKGRIAIEVMRDRMNRAVSPMFAQLDRLGREDALFGVKDDTGRVTATRTNGEAAQVFVQEIAENPSRYQLSASQETWLAAAQEINQAPKKILEAHGQKVKETEHSTEYFVGRIIVKKENAAGDIVELGYVPTSTKRGLAGRATTIRARAFDSTEEAIAAGFLPEPSYSRTLLLRSRSAAREAVNIRVGHWMGQHLKEAHAGNVPGLEVLGNRAGRRAGEQSLELLLNTRGGVRPRTFRLAGPEAQAIREFAEKIAHEGELMEANRAVQIAAKVGALQRFGILTLDFSIFTIQSLALLSSRPIAGLGRFGRNAQTTLKGLLKPDGLIAARSARIDDFARDGGFARHPKLILDYGGLSEFTEAAEMFDNLAARAEQGRPSPDTEELLALGLGANELMQRFSLGFDSMRDLMAISWAEIAEDVTRHLPDGIRQQRIDAMDDMTNFILGRFRTASLGIAGAQRAAESVMFLAPQYYRASVAMLARMFEGGARGNEARKAMVKLYGSLSALVFTYNALYYRFQERRSTADSFNFGLRTINPTSRDYMSFTINGPGNVDMKVGLGGMPRALMSLIVETAAGSELGTGQDDFGFGPTSGAGRLENAGRFYQGRAGPVLRLLTDLVTAQDFVGQNTNVSTPDGLRRIITNNALPIFLQGAIDEFDTGNLARSLVKLGPEIMGMNPRLFSKQDLRQQAARGLYPSGNYDDMEPWERGYVNSMADREIMARDQQQVESQGSGISSADAALWAREGRSEREETLLADSLNATIDTGALYRAWESADDIEWGRRQERGRVYDAIFEERPPDLPEGELEQAFQIWLGILDEDNLQLKDQALAAFDRAYPITSEVGQYIRRQTNQRRAPMTLLQRLPNYSKTKGVLDSAYARYLAIHERVSQEEGPEVAQAKADAYWRWFFMMDEATAAWESMRQPALAAP